MKSEAQIVLERKGWPRGRLNQAIALTDVVSELPPAHPRRHRAGIVLLDALSIAEEWGVTAGQIIVLPGERE